MRVGMLGLGIMGAAMSRNLIAAGHAVYGADPLPQPQADLREMGGTVVPSAAAAAAECEVLVAVLPSVAALEQVVWGGEGLLAAGRSGLIVAECSTFGLEDKLAARDALAEAGITLLDCPLSGTGAQAVTRDLAVYASGERAAFDACRPVFDGFARASHYLGEFGNGTKMKFVANLLVAIHNASAAEAFVLGMKAGLDPQMIYDVVGDGAGSSRMFQVRGPLMVRDEYEPPTMKVDIWQKDMALIGKFAADLGVPTPLLAASAQLYTAAMAQGRGKQDTAAVCAVLEDMARLERSS